MIIIVAVSGCANLPADFPRPPVVDLCAPVLNGVKGDSDRMIQSWRCRMTNTKTVKDEPANHVQIGIPIESWNEGQKYRSEVEEYFKTHSCKAR